MWRRRQSCHAYTNKCSNNVIKSTGTGSFVACLVIPNTIVTFAEHVLNLCLSGKLGRVPSLLKMEKICLLAIRSALSEQHAPEVIPLDSRWKEWTLCLPANLIPPLSTAKSSRQRESPGKFTKRFSPHCWLEESTTNNHQQTGAEGTHHFFPDKSLRHLMSLVSHQYRWKVCLSLKSSAGPLLGPELQHRQCICWWSFNEKCHCCIMCRADFKASNGLFRGRGCLGPTFPAAHSTQESRRWLRGRWEAALEVVSASGFSVQHLPLSSCTLCKYFVYCWCDSIEAWKPVGTEGCGTLPKETEAVEANTLPKECSTELPVFVWRFLYLWVSAWLSKHILLRKFLFRLLIGILHLWGDMRGFSRGVKCAESCGTQTRWLSVLIGRYCVFRWTCLAILLLRQLK